MKFVLSKELVDAIVTYLAKCPWNEVNGLINGINREIQASRTTPQVELVEKKDPQPKPAAVELTKHVD